MYICLRTYMCADKNNNSVCILYDDDTYKRAYVVHRIESEWIPKTFLWLHMVLARLHIYCVVLYTTQAMRLVHHFFSILSTN